MSPRPIVIDCDPGVDDAIALLLGLASTDEFDVVGVSTVAGNVGLDRTSNNALRISELADRDDVPVYAGCPGSILRPRSDARHVHGETSLDGVDLPPPASAIADRHAVDFLIETCAARPGEVILCAMGPLTNVAS